MIEAEFSIEVDVYSAWQKKVWGPISLTLSVDENFAPVFGSPPKTSPDFYVITLNANE